MPARLKDRQKQIPYGIKFYQPETGWKPRAGSFQQIVQQIIQHRMGNPALLAKHNWNTDPAAVEVELDEFNARICLSMGWNDYVASTGEGPPPPKPMPQLQQEAELISAAAGRAKKIWSGVKTLNEWIDSGEPPVESSRSEIRASVCAVCPKNTKGDFTTWFTKPAALAIQKQVERLSDRKLSTSRDDALNVCDVCLCPLKLKVHTPLKYIKSHMAESVFLDLEKVPGCWVVAEVKAS
jgi:hypothetical protein